jgi:benzoyl-CoA reductase/2-hydroxyglutaryl-CoA dehydratase subunit BcrC/BadD/HgdB
MSSSELVKWLKKQADESSGIEGIKANWLCTAALAMCIEAQTKALERTNELLERLVSDSSKRKSS